MAIRALIVLLPALLAVKICPAQEYLDRDSLWSALKRAAPDSQKVQLFINLGQQYEMNDPDSALLLYESALKLSREIGYTRGVISYYTNATYVYNLKGMLDTALALNLRSLEIAREFGDPERITACLGNVGSSYMLKDEPEKAIEYFLEIIPMIEKQPYDRKKALIYDNLCVLYADIGQPDRAIEYGQHALDIYRRINNAYGLASSLINLAVAHIEQGRHELAVPLLQESVSISRRTNNQYALMVATLNLTDVNIDLGRFAKLKSYADEALALAVKLKDRNSETIALRGLAIFHFNMNSPREAERYARQSLQLAMENNYLKEAGKAYGILSSIAVLDRDFQRANRYAIKDDSIRQLIFNEKRAKNIQDMEAKYNSLQREQHIRDLEQAAAIKDLTIRESRLVNGILIGSLVSLLAIAVLGRRNYQQKKALLMQENRVQEVRIAQLESEKQILAGEAIIKGQEEERGRLAKDLHDGLGGMLSGLKFSLTNMKSNVVLDADNALVFERSLDMLDYSISELRRVAHNMMPEVLVKFGLAEALNSYCESLRASQMFKLDFQAINMDERLPDKTEIFIFRIVGELLNNTIKHAKASHVLVQVARHENEVGVTVEDDGVGFDPGARTKTPGAGWYNIRSRVDYLKGKVDIQSEPGRGTSVHITIPLAHDEDIHRG